MRPVFPIDINDFQYDLPTERIAQFPAGVRDQSRLLILKNGLISEDVFFRISEHLPAGGVLVRNNSRVIHARLQFMKESGAVVEIFCLEPFSPHSEISSALQSGPGCKWKCLIGNARKWKTGPLKQKVAFCGKEYCFFVEKVSSENGVFVIQFNWEPPDISFADILEIAGKIPLPPYILRGAESSDHIRYQTVYAERDGSVAAPTAGLHFSDEVMASLKKIKTRSVNITLHVGAGTFKPVSVKNIRDHQMHPEQISIQRQTLEALLSAETDIIAVGTTTLRALESFYQLGVRIIKGEKPEMPFCIEQWESYLEACSSGIATDQAWQALLNFMKEYGLDMLNGETRLMIIPGYRIRTADILITNFHQPRSSLLLLVAAFAGGSWKQAYHYALQNHFRFLSYGDVCLFYKNREIVKE